MALKEEDIILRLLRGDISDVEERWLRRWRRQAAANEQRYQELARVWSFQPPAPPGSPPPRPTAAQVIASVQARRARVAIWRPWLWLSRKQLLRYAAALGLLAVPFLALEFATRRDSPGGVAAAEFATEAGETVTVTLTDGSFVRLAPSSRLRLSPVSGEREVSLEGRAFFAVATDTARPFTVRTRAGDIQVRGTRFDLRVQEETLQLAVVEGQVDIGSGRTRVAVAAGEVGQVREGEAPAVIRVADITEFIDWRGGMLLYRATPLQQAARELERHFEIPFVIRDSSFAERTVTGSFTDRTLDEVVIAICRAIAAQCAIESDRVVIGQ